MSIKADVSPDSASASFFYMSAELIAARVMAEQIADRGYAELFEQLRALLADPLHILNGGFRGYCHIYDHDFAKAKSSFHCRYSAAVTSDSIVKIFI